MDKAETQMNQANSSSPYNHIYFVRQLFNDLGGASNPDEVIIWMAHALAENKVREIFPGLVSEYIRRFGYSSSDFVGYDKVLHFVDGAALGIKCGTPISFILGVIGEVGDFIKDRNYAHCASDFRTHLEGLEFIREIRQIYHP